MIKTLLQVGSAARPTCDAILKMDIIKKRMGAIQKNEKIDTYVADFEEDDDMNLLNTIKVPRNLTQLTNRLPRSKYANGRGPHDDKSFVSSN